MDSRVIEITEPAIRHNELDALKTPSTDRKATDNAIAKLLNTTQCIDCIEGMKMLPADSIDMVVTSPPYDGIRDYKGFSIDLRAVSEDL